MTRGALAELGFHFVFEIADYELGHLIAYIDIMISLMPVRSYFFGISAQYPMSRR
jgi:hypothetical protein